jgi:hypothetical protein
MDGVGRSGGDMIRRSWTECCETKPTRQRAALHTAQATVMGRSDLRNAQTDAARPAGRVVRLSLPDRRIRGERTAASAEQCAVHRATLRLQPPVRAEHVHAHARRRLASWQMEHSTMVPSTVRAFERLDSEAMLEMAWSVLVPAVWRVPKQPGERS